MISIHQSSKRNPMAGGALILLAALGLVACGDDFSGTPSSSSAGGGGTGGGDTSSTGGAGEGGMTTTSSVGGAGGSGGVGGSAPTDSCTPVDGLPVGDDCGVFVDSTFGGTSDGTMNAPYTSITEALAQADTSKSIYVCKTSNLSEAVYDDTSKNLYGGIDCDAGWVWDDAGRTYWTAPSGAIPLRTKGVGVETIQLVGFEIESADVDGEQFGVSSIAALFEGGGVDIAHVDFRAGDGSWGLPGIAGTAGAAGGNAGSPQPYNPGTSTCGAGGGVGGLFLFGSDTGHGGAGLPTGPGGAGGIGEPEALVCMTGTAGMDGAPGLDGADATGLGMLSATGWSNLLATDGTDGKTAGGGGGGGQTQDSGTNYQGGGGGGGGCLGTHGTHGMSGGASIAIVSLGAALTFADSSAKSGIGGDGGHGGASGAGGTGGQGHGGVQGCQPFILCPTMTGCHGADGGDGGSGGRGGGGAGGHSIVVAFTGPAPTLTGLDVTVPNAADAGAGANNAASGIAAVSQAF